jgi:hypothetical protein
MRRIRAEGYRKKEAPLDPQEVRASMRRLFAGGRYRDISVRGCRWGCGHADFTGVERYYVGRVTIEG